MFNARYALSFLIIAIFLSSHFQSSYNNLQFINHLSTTKFTKSTSSSHGSTLKSNKRANTHSSGTVSTPVYIKSQIKFKSQRLIYGNLITELNNISQIIGIHSQLTSITAPTQGNSWKTSSNHLLFYISKSSAQCECAFRNSKTYTEPNNILESSLKFVLKHVKRPRNLGLQPSSDISIPLSRQLISRPDFSLHISSEKCNISLQLPQNAEASAEVNANCSRPTDNYLL